MSRLGKRRGRGRRVWRKLPIAARLRGAASATRAEFLGQIFGPWEFWCGDVLAWQSRSQRGRRPPPASLVRAAVGGVDPDPLRGGRSAPRCGPIAVAGQLRAKGLVKRSPRVGKALALANRRDGARALQNRADRRYGGAGDWRGLSPWRVPRRSRLRSSPRRGCRWRCGGVPSHAGRCSGSPACRRRRPSAPLR